MTSIIIDPDLEDSEKQLIKQYLPAHSYAVVTDDNTFRVLGKRILQALSATTATHISLGNDPVPTSLNVKRIRQESAGNQAIIAVGSGTINDLCKYAAGLEGKPYGVFATAASMNGYISPSATIWTKGQKTSFPCPPPRALFCDLRVIAQAPARLTLSGLGDSLCRPTAEADWLLSHLLLGTDYLEEPFQMLAEFEEDLFTRGHLLRGGDLESVALLLQTLIASGKGMQMAGGSYPASQGEHMIAHVMEMQHPALCYPTYHGEQIGVLTLLMANLQRKILTRAAPLQLQWRPPPHSWRKTYEKKIPNAAFVEALNRKLHDRWDEICMKIRPFTLQPMYLRGVLEDTGAPVTVEELGWTREQVEEAAKLAPFTRDRFTFLDIAVLAGMDPLLLG